MQKTQHGGIIFIMSNWNERPNWFQGAWVESLQYINSDHALIETLLGCGRLIDERKVEEARSRYDNFIFPLILQHRFGNHEYHELDSSQVVPMLNSGLYPPDLCEELRPYFPNIEH